MVRQNILCFYPERVAQIGAAVLGTLFLLAAPYAFYTSGSPVSLQKHTEKEAALAPLCFSLGLSSEGPSFPIPELQGELSFSFDPPRPSGAVGEPRLLVRLKKSAESRHVSLPCRVDLEFQKGKLVFAKEKSSFWIELASAGNGKLEAKGYIASPEGAEREGGTFLAAVEESPLRAAQEFGEGTPFRLLAEARWWGRDLFREQFEAPAVERLEVGTEFLEIQEGDWLVWNGDRWQKSSETGSDKPIAHVQSLKGKTLVLEGWDLESHIRLSVGPAALPPFKMRGEDLFSAIRMRSEKQISCMLEKQCMVLKAGDWVLKSGSRWKILRKAQEREAYLNGKLAGELFVFDQIQAKQGQKMMHGRLFNQGRTQMIPIEMAAQSTRKAGEKSVRRGKSA